MNRVVKILMERDGNTKEEAERILKNTRDEMMEDIDNSEEIMRCNLGLELDYVFDII